MVKYFYEINILGNINMIITKKSIFNIFFIIAVIAILGILFGVSIIRDTKFSEARNTYKNALYDIENYSDQTGIIKSITVNTDFHDSRNDSHYTKIDSVDVHVNISDHVENMSAQQKCSFLHTYQTTIEKLIQTAKEQSGYEQIILNNESSRGYIKYKGKHVQIDDAINIEFISTKYKYVFYPTHFYVTEKNLGRATKYRYKFEDNTLVHFYNPELEKEQIIPPLPYVGMREEYLQYTSLGKPDLIEKCRDFDVLVARAKHKTYEWGNPFEHGWYKIIVSYRQHFSRRFDDYEDLPASNGFVSSITYTDENGHIVTENYTDTY